MKNAYSSKQKVVLASILLTALAGGSFIFKDELFPNPGIYLQYVGASQYPVHPVIIALKLLSSDKLKQEFEWELPMPVPQFTVAKADLDEMVKQMKVMLPTKDCEAKDTQFVVTVTGKGRVMRREIDNNKIWSILGYLQRYTALKYRNLSLEISILEDYSKMDVRHPLPPDPFNFSVLGNLKKSQSVQKHKKKQ
jgi:hypothetical protein